eukprot:TRINITY_DN50946_c0_g1_i1.p1 TRINITY_DN50946_c0_g1~~TRINITY_DN50946_c0_g1_i1.p1  ORF type:complete len:293 (+),score=54.86 TRINITY_DN50946_c0_g1_i1:163-1041(+)
MNQDSLVVRYFFEGDKARNGVLATVPRRSSGGECAVAVLKAIAQAEVDLTRFEVVAWSPAHEGWCSLKGATTDSGDLFAWLPDIDRVDVMLKRQGRPSQSNPAESSYDHRTELKSTTSDGFFGVALLRSTSELNHGTLWRSASTFGASFMATIGAPYSKSVEGCTNTTNAAKGAPMWRFDAWGDFCKVAPMDAPWVAIEMGGEDLDTFVHPARCVYILGSEAQGLPSSVVKACVAHVSIPAAENARTHSSNVAVAGAIVMYDRLAKQRGTMSKGLELGSSDDDDERGEPERF